MKIVPLLILTAAVTSVLGTAHAVEFKSVGANPTILYDAPSERGRKVFVAPRGMPVEVVLTYGDWSKVRDIAGDLSWIESKALSSKRNVLVKAGSARIHSAPEENSPVVFAAERGVLLEMLENVTSAWVKVKHRDGQAGFARALDVWGD